MSKRQQSQPKYYSVPYDSQEQCKLCAWEGCLAQAVYPAPKSRHVAANEHPENPTERFHYFCLDHVRDYNKKWNFFAGMGAEEIERFQKDAVTGHRPTKTMGLGAGGQKLFTTEDLRDLLHREGFIGTNSAPEYIRSGPKLKPEENQALTLFELKMPFSMTALKTRFKQMVKRHHPDANGGDKSSEEKFKQIVSAYHVLKGFL